MCTADQLYGNFKDFCKTSQKDIVSEMSFKQTCSALVDIKTSSIQVNKVPVTVYKGLIYVPKPPTQSADLNDLPSGWFVQNQQDGIMTLASKTPVSLNDINLCKEVIVNQDGAVSINVRGKSIIPSEVGLPDSLTNSVLGLSQYVIRVTELHVCLGKETNVPNSTKCTVNGTVTHRKHSKTCHGLLPLLSQGNICQRCHSISTVSNTQSDDEADISVDTSVNNDDLPEANKCRHDSDCEVDISHFPRV